ncbi:restriction endonuclease subunit S [Helicobacter pylori]|uniref:restriction endonuclease subunit S n=1 Tax=Helicobacter pylori TaxID=210 RepID=UPI0018D00499|nr:restriction endonuclease subunit S [Helicobacter pylori]MBH0277875.1 restriction endonuclease subunit S [Helicobacter pylori]MBH0280790.1 restriction endonuclease subunit S [Helicobacter pylori]MBH0284384.1 restriction endonuclease subunit S [Helicobacter pylori]
MDAFTTPSNWQRVRLGDIGKPCMCKRVMKHQTTRYGEIPFYKIGTFGNTADAFISKKLFLEYKTKYSFPKKGDILVSASGTIGRAVIYDGKPAYFQDSNIVWIDNDETLVKNDFLFYAYSNVKWNTEHTTILRLYNDNFRNTLIPLPPLNEQIAIANVLSDLDRYLYSLDALILKKESVKKALSFELLSQRKRLKGFNQAWQKVKVKDFGIIITGSTPLTQISEYWNGTISWITPTDINDNKDIFNSERKITQKGLDTIRMIPKNSVLVTCIASIGKNAILRVNGACNQQINAIIPNKDFNADFIYYLMENNKQYLLGKAGVTATYIISKQVFEEIDFFVPKDLDEQAAIANILSALDNEIISLKNKKRQFENIKKALNHDLMSAKIRVLKKINAPKVKDKPAYKGNP